MKRKKKSITSYYVHGQEVFLNFEKNLNIFENDDDGSKSFALLIIHDAIVVKPEDVIDPFALGVDNSLQMLLTMTVRT